MPTLASAARAGDRPGALRVNFSPNGQHALVVTGGVQDGSGFSTAALTVLDTGTGRTRFAAAARSETRPVSAVVGGLLSRERPRLAALGLPRVQEARPVYAHPTPVAAPAWSEGLQAGQAVTLPIRLWSRPVPVRLEVRALPPKCAFRDMLPPGAPPAGFTLKVGGQAVHTDRALPAARACAAGYALDRVYVRGNRAVFLVRVYTPGFEGPNAELMAVATTLK